jgi:hypothetical protein
VTESSRESPEVLNCQFLAEESFEFHGEEEAEDEEEEETDGSSDDDAELMAQALQKAEKPPAKFFQMENDEPIALDDSDDDDEEEEEDRDSDEFSVDNNVMEEEEEEAAELQAMLREKSTKTATKPNLLRMRETLKKSIKTLTTKRFERKKIEKVKDVEEVEVPEEVEVEVPEEVKIPEEVIKQEEKVTEVEAMEVEVPEEVPIPTPLPIETLNEPEKEVTAATKPVEKIEPPEVPVASSSLLTEITSSSLEDIFARYVPKAPSDQSPTLDEFSEELFFCLQQNKQEIEKAAQLWNEKLHVKYKIRELMETIRRHRAVMEIETFGKLPESANNHHPMISSKSSTTTNSEADHHEKQFRMSSESVSRLIQDVRASMLKRDEKDNESGQLGAAQGRQGQIIDVQSIINDFRQKNPQEIPRRGRRMKSSFGYDNQQNSHDFSGSNGHDFNSTAKSNVSGASGGYPEVSLHPVHNLYKNLANATGGPHFSGGQKSSLLQSILTKVRIRDVRKGNWNWKCLIPIFVGIKNSKFL